MADFVLGRSAPPKLRHSNGLPVVQIGLLQQFGSGALSGACGRYLVYGPAEYLIQCFHLFAIVQHLELLEQLYLQCRRAFFPFCSQLLYLLFIRIDCCLQGICLFFPRPFQPFVFSFLKLAFAYQGGLFFGYESGFFSACFPFLFRFFQLQFGCIQCVLCLPACLFQFGQ